LLWYNHPRIALAHRPFTEWYIFPWLVVGVTVTVVYAASAFFLCWPLFSRCCMYDGYRFVVSMMRRTFILTGWVGNYLICTLP